MKNQFGLSGIWDKMNDAIAGAASALIIAVFLVMPIVISCNRSADLKNNNNSGYDFEIVSEEFNGKDETYTVSLNLIKIGAADTPKKQRLNALLDSLLYDGLTAEAYLNQWKKKVSEETHGSYDETVEWDIDGKYLHVKRGSSGCSASCSANEEHYIIDTAAIKYLSHDELLANVDGDEFTTLVKKLIEDDDRYNYIDTTALNESLRNKTYGIYFERGIGVVFHWNKYQIAAGAAGDFEVMISYSGIKPFLTPVGRELLGEGD